MKGLAFETKHKIKLLRKKGFSLSYIANVCHISKSTASLIARTVHLDKQTYAYLLQNSRKMAVYTRNNKRKAQEEHIKSEIELELSSLKLDIRLSQVLCALLFWTEGSKNPTSRVTFTNSDPVMVASFLSLLRIAFPIDESKLRALIHIHDYHNESELKMFWSDITKIPIIQFHKSYKKVSSHKHIKKGYKGTISVTYYDARIALRLRLLYNVLSEHIRSVDQR